MEWMPLALLAVIRYMQRPSRWRFVAVAVTVMLSGLSSVYYLMMFGTGLALFLVIEAVRQRGMFFSRRTVFTRAAYGLIGALALASDYRRRHRSALSDDATRAPYRQDARRGIR